MEENQFKPGDIVYHKANNLRMVVIGIKGDQSNCRFVEKAGVFKNDLFFNIELSNTPLDFMETPVVSQLVYKGIESRSK
ncbi:hypothetical protein [Sphingobacterium sp. MYb388]|uniref:hypothetical protein n=1 Tax=Sphingobacterium sp. MYb388 TaxID=2745437 RepID=UPI00309FF102